MKDFILLDHPYVFLATSAMSLVGILLAQSTRSPFSILANHYTVEQVMFYILVSWIVISLLALISKIKLKGEYSTSSLFVGDSAKKLERIGSYVVWVCVAVLAYDRVVMYLAYSFDYAVHADANPQGFIPSVFYMLYQGRDVFITGIKTTVELSVFGTLIAFVLSLLLTFLRVQKVDRQDNDFVRFLKTVGCGFAKVYSSVVRGTPMMIQGLIIYFAGFSILLNSGMSSTEASGVWSTFTAGLITVSMNSTAYMMEVLRGGIESIDKGQMEAARSLGLSQWQAMRKVIFPQGVKNAIPALSNELVVNIKDSSVLSVIGVFDLMFATTTVAGIYYRQMEIYVLAAIMYFILTMVASLILNRLAKRLEVENKTLLSTCDMEVVSPVKKGA